MKSTCFLLLFLLMHLSIIGQEDCLNTEQENCLDAGFESGTLGDHLTYTGTLDTCGNLAIGVKDTCGVVNISTLLRYDPERFTIMNANGIDTIARDSCEINELFKTVPDGGGDHALRLGNAASGAQAEKIVLKFKVTPTLTFFLLNYAVFLNDPGHHPDQQPRFEMNIKDQEGNPVDCGKYEVRAKEMIEGFENCKGEWKVRPWTAVGFELQSFLGDTIQIEILTTDCAQGAHAGYAYIDANFRPLEIVLEGYCPDSTTAQLRVTEGFIKYEWSTGRPADTSNIINLINPTPDSIYSVTVTSGTGCTLVLSDTIPTLEEFPIPEFDLVPNTTICEGDSLFFQPTGINLKEIISLDSLVFNSTETSFVLPGTETKEYLFVAFGLYRCVSDTLSVKVEVEKFPKSFFATSADTLCSGDTLLLDYQSTGDLNKPFWILGNSSTYCGLKPPPQIYDNDTDMPLEIKITLIDSTACKVDSFIKKITILNAPQAEIDMLEAVCVDETIAIKATGEDFFTYQWFLGNGQKYNKRAIALTYEKAGTDTIQLVVTDARTCTKSYRKMLTINELPKSDFESIVNTTCPPARLLLKNKSQFAPDYNDTYEWQKDGQFLSTEKDVRHTFEEGGNFIIELITKNKNGCINTSEKNIFIPSNPEAIIQNSEDVGCINTDIHLEGASGESPWTYQWLLSNGMGFYNQNPIFQVEESGTVTATLIVSNGDCLDTTATTIEVTRPSQLNLSIDEEDQIIDLGETLDLLVTFDATFPIIKWHPEDGLNCSDCANPTVQPLKSTRYTVIIQEENACVDSAFINIRVRQNDKLFIPTAFSPNEDGINDLFYAEGNNPSIAQILSFRVFDRWGELVFDFPIPIPIPMSDFGWDGTFNGQRVLPGVYLYYIEIEFIDGGVLYKKGTVTLVR